MGKNINRVREEKRITQEYLGQKLGMSQQAFSNLERRPVIDDATLAKLSKIMDVPVDDFKVDDGHNSIGQVVLESGSLGHFFNNVFNPIEKVVELYERVISEQEARIKALEETIRELKQQRQ